jgi:hypothetical protein
MPPSNKEREALIAADPRVIAGPVVAPGKRLIATDWNDDDAYSIRIVVGVWDARSRMARESGEWSDSTGVRVRLEGRGRPDVGASTAAGWAPTGCVALAAAHTAVARLRAGDDRETALREGMAAACRVAEVLR